MVGARTSYPHTRLIIEQTNFGASHFRLPKSHFWPSEAAHAKSDSTIPFGRPNSTGMPHFVMIGDRRCVNRRVTDIQTDVTHSLKFINALLIIALASLYFSQVSS